MASGIEIPSENPHPHGPPPGQPGVPPPPPVEGHPPPAGQAILDKAAAYYEMPQWKLMWRRFRKHRVALWMLHVVIILYVLCLNCDFLAPYDPSEIHGRSVEMPPQVLRAGFSGALPQLYVHPFVLVQDPVTLKRQYWVNRQERTPLRWFVHGQKWKFMGLIQTDVHLFGTYQVSCDLSLIRVSDGAIVATAGGSTGPGGLAELAKSVCQKLAEPLAAKGDSVAVLNLRNNSGTARGRDLAGEMNQHVGRSLVASGGFQIHQRLEFPEGMDEKDVQNAELLKDDAARAKFAGSQYIVAGRVSENTCFLLGTDKLGQDLFSRILHGGRISLLLGLTGELLTFVLGISLGGISGYYGGKVDIIIQRIVEILQSIPTIPIWLAMAAAIPKEWTSLQGYFAMTMILAIIGWTGLCRVVRGKLLALREEDYSRAALLAGASERRVIFVHLVPNFLSHIIASMTLAIPGIILAETSLSFLGLGLRPPIVSWGVLLQDAQSVSTVVNQPWMLLPAVMVIIAVLAFNFAGDGLRDAADPYAN